MKLISEFESESESESQSRRVGQNETKDAANSNDKQ